MRNFKLKQLKKKNSSDSGINNNGFARNEWSVFKLWLPMQETLRKIDEKKNIDAKMNDNTTDSCSYVINLPPRNSVTSESVICQDVPPVPPPKNSRPLAPPVPLRSSKSILHSNCQTNPIIPSVHPQSCPSCSVFPSSLPHSNCIRTCGARNDYRNSPSSGFFSCTSPCSVSPSFNSNYDQEDNLKFDYQSSQIFREVKSTTVEKPLPQTAIPLLTQNPPLPPPPPFLVTTIDLHKFFPVPSTQPPSYTSTVSSSVTQSNTTCISVNVHEHPAHSFHKGILKVEHKSPIPTRKVNQNELKVRSYSSQAFKFYMEQHTENVNKYQKQRMHRRVQLDQEMERIGLSPEAQLQMRKMLNQKESNYIRLKRSKLDKSMFTKIKLIGVGAFGEVTLVRKHDTNQLYAMKTLRKVDVLRRNQVAHVKAERDILAEADNEWVVKLYFSFQDIDNLYFVMEYIPGGDLMSLLIKFGIFDEKLSRFYTAELTCAVESVHKIGFIHRDIKPDNILIDRDGHIKLTDFGLCTGFRWTHNSKYYENGHDRQDSMDFMERGDGCTTYRRSKLKPLERRRRREEQKRSLAHSLVGTPNYIAPEVLLRAGYSQLCDWWSVGVVLYEMLIGAPPFFAETSAETQYKIINWEKTLKIPSSANISSEAIDLILKLCTNQERRLGKNAGEIMQHPFLQSIDFSEGVRKLIPPYIPKIRHTTDTSNFDPIETDDSGECSSSMDSNILSDRENKASHGFFEFTFRRFFDDLPSKIFIDDPESQNAIYV